MVNILQELIPDFHSNDDGGSWTACNFGITLQKSVIYFGYGSKIFAGVNGIYIIRDLCSLVK